MSRLLERYPSIPWIAPFAAYMLLLALGPYLPLAQPWESVFRVGVLTAVIGACSWPLVRSFRLEHPVASVLLGLAVCALWVLPDALIPGWRSHAIFQNSLTGTLKTSIAPAELANPLVVVLRVLRAAILVPILEELFWRGWLPRWIVNNDWQKVQLGTYSTLAFVATAALFASEHGPFWEVGLLCGLIYNWWMWRTKSIGDLVLVHGVTNAALAGYVLVTGKYEYWM
jgi:CAAX prenyl protease-like protein